MLNAPHIFETALLFLVAFLLGAVAGYLARRLILPGRAVVETTVAAAAPATSQPQLVVAPTIAPLPTGDPVTTGRARGRGRSAASRLAAAAGREPDNEPVAAGQPELAAPVPEPVPEPSGTPIPVASHEMRPARVAGAATSGIVIPSPSPVVAPPVEPEPAPAPVRAEDVPPIDETAHVIDIPPELSIPDEPLAAPPVPAEEPSPVAPAEPEALVAAAQPQEPVAAEPPPEPHPPEPVILPEMTLSDDDEAAAMRAVEGRVPRRTAAAASRPVPHPEEAAAEVDAAMASARTAVAAATAAAAAAIADSGEPPALDFDPGAESAAEPFLETATGTSAGASTPGGLSFEPLRPRSGYGRPEGLPAPRGGTADNLKQIKGITPALETSLNAIGIYHFDQVAGWDQKAVIWLDHHLALKGRVGREKWQEQARDLSRRRGHPVRPVRR